MPSVRSWHAVFVFAASILLAAACGPEQSHGGHGAFGMRHGLGLMTHAARLGMRGTRPRGFRRACADDAARLCPDAKRPRDMRECLQGKQNSLSADCKAALTRRRD
jgi:hypothetical protein